MLELMLSWITTWTIRYSSKHSLMEQLGLATLAIPIMAPLADAVNVPRDVIITACIFGQGLMSL